MKKALAKGLLVIIEAGIDVLVERIKKRRGRNGRNHRRLGGGTYCVRHQSGGHCSDVDDRCMTIGSHTHGRSISWERQNTKKGVRSNERTKHVPRG